MLVGRADRGFWLVILAALGVFFGAADQTAVASIFPDMIDGVRLTANHYYQASWIINGYILGYIVAMPLMARIADSFGHGRVFALSLALFCAGSVWVALSTDLTVLSVGRAVQAVGGGAVVPVSLAIVTAHVPASRRAVGIGAMAAAAEAGGLIGPLWGGVIAALIGWRGVFWINLPICLTIALLVGWLSRANPPSRHLKIDYVGAVILGLSLVCLTVALTDNPVAARPVGVTLALYAGAALLFSGFALRQWLTPFPLIDPAMFRRLKVGAAFLTNGLTGGTLITAMVSIPLFSNVILNTTALQGGLNLMRLTVALPISAVVGGLLARRWGLAPVAALGMSMAGTGFVAMSRWPADPSFVVMTGPLLLVGAGFGLIIAPLNTAVLDAAPETERATAASLLTVVRLLGALVGVALLTTRGLSSFYTGIGSLSLTAPDAAEQLTGLELSSFQGIFLAAALVCFFSVLPSMLLGRARAGHD